MDAYIYQADIYCEKCGEAIKAQLDAEGKTPPNPDDKRTYDSDEYPKGPYPDGGGESDIPQHCASGEDCLDYISLTNDSNDEPQIRIGAFLENPLTLDGIRYVMDTEDTVVSRIWREHYS